MDTKWKSIKAGLSFCFLVISLTILVIFGGIGAIAMRSLDLRQIGDAFLADYQQTDDFRDVMEGYLLDGLEVAMFSSDGHLESLAQDRNLRYEIYDGNRLIESNTQEIGDSLKRRTAKGYNFYLKYEDGAVQIWKDGAELDIYGDGVYRGAWDQWDVPGYSNRSISDYLYDWITAQDPDEIREMTQNVIIYLGAVETPAQYQQWSGIYQVTMTQQNERFAVLIVSVAFLLGLALLVWTILWRHHLGRAWAALGRLTGKVWLECKLVVLLPLLWVLFIVLIDLFNGYANTEHVLILWLGALLLALYVNDWVHNWGHLRARSFCVWMMENLRAKEVTLPVGQRLQKRSFVAWLGVLILAAGAAALDFLLFLASLNDPLLAVLSILIGLVGLAILVQQWNHWKAQKQLARDLGKVTQQITDMREGRFAVPEQLPADGDLAEFSEALTQIGDGLQKAVEERIHSERMKVELITNVSHDLKTPLTSILSYSDLLAQEELPAAARDYVTILQEKAERLKVMVSEVFEVSKATTGNLDLKLEELDLCKLVRQTLADQGESIEESGLVFRVNLPEEEVLICADGDRLYRVFQNLLQNALHYAMPGSRVYVTLENGPERAEVWVRNISRDELPQNVDFTERFVRGDESRTDGGSGLGLAIAKSFTEACGGQFRVETQADLFTAKVIFPKK